MASYQDIETRLRVVEDKVDLIMKSVTFTKKFRHPISDEVVTESMTLLDIYRQLKTLGHEPVNATGNENGTDL